ncbi:MAG: ferredoxin:protochlorophyllide reductase (ATP-dependent) subunit B [Granulosicoccus sp.]
MELSLWTYEGPPHVGAMRIATSMRDVHYVLHAPQGDTYADLLFTMIERQNKRPPVTYTTFQARDLGGDTANMLKTSIREAYDRFQPQALMVGESCTAELIQDQPGSLASGMGIPVPVVPLELPSYSKKENWGASESFYYLVRHVLAHESSQNRNADTESSDTEASNEQQRPTANLLGPTSLGFRCRDDIVEISKLLGQIGVDVNVVAPLDATTDDLRRIPNADFNISLYPETSRTLCTWLERTFKQPTIKSVPIGVNATVAFIEEIEALTGIDASTVKNTEQSRLPWYSRSVDSNYLTGKRVFIFADGSHAIAAARIARDELGFTVVGIGTFSREMAKDVRSVAKEFDLEALITDDYLEVEQHIEALHPELVLGTQMERHIAKRLSLPCAVISTPIHVQDVPARYSPQMGFEGANVIFDTWVHPLLMGLEEHLLHMFRDDFEFNDDATPSHLQGSEGAGTTHQQTTEATAENPVKASEAATPTVTSAADVSVVATATEGSSQWADDAEKELKKIPFFVRGKARRNTEEFARMRGDPLITVDTLYDAKAHYAR